MTAMSMMISSITEIPSADWATFTPDGSSVNTHINYFYLFRGGGGGGVGHCFAVVYKLIFFFHFCKIILQKQLSALSLCFT